MVWRHVTWFRDDETGELVAVEHGSDGTLVEDDRHPPNAPQKDAADRVPGRVVDVARCKVACLQQVGQPVRDLVSVYPECLDALNNGNWPLARQRIAQAAADGDPPTISASDSDALLAILDSHGIPDPGT